MSVIKKLVTLLRGSARELGQSMVDGNATRIYEQEIVDAKASLQQARGELTGVMAQEMQTARDIERIQGEIQRHENMAMQVLDKAEQGEANEALAEKVAARVAALEGELHTQTTTHAGLVMQIGKLKELIRTAERRIREHEREISIAKTTESVYRATQSISDSMGTTGSRLSSAKESLERIKQRHQTLADRVVAADRLEHESGYKALEDELAAVGIGENDASRTAAVMERLRARRAPPAAPTAPASAVPDSPAATHLVQGSSASALTFGGSAASSEGDTQPA